MYTLHNLLSCNRESWKHCGLYYMTDQQQGGINNKICHYKASKTQVCLVTETHRSNIISCAIEDLFLSQNGSWCCTTPPPSFPSASLVLKYPHSPSLTTFCMAFAFTFKLRRLTLVSSSKYGPSTISVWPLSLDLVSFSTTNVCYPFYEVKGA